MKVFFARSEKRIFWARGMSEKEEERVDGERISDQVCIEGMISVSSLFTRSLGVFPVRVSRSICVNGRCKIVVLIVD